MFSLTIVICAVIHVVIGGANSSMTFVERQFFSSQDSLAAIIKIIMQFIHNFLNGFYLFHWKWWTKLSDVLDFIHIVTQI